MRRSQIACLTCLTGLLLLLGCQKGPSIEPPAESKPSASAESRAPERPQGSVVAVLGADGSCTLDGRRLDRGVRSARGPLAERLGKIQNAPGSPEVRSVPPLVVRVDKDTPCKDVVALLRRAR